MRNPANWFKPSREMIAAPYFHPSVVLYLDYLLTNSMTVCEFGGGGSTLWLARRVKSVKTFETSKAWADKLHGAKPDNVTIVYSGDPPKETFDMVIIDGEPVEKRAEWISYAGAMVKDGGIVILDNANRPEYQNERALLQKQAAHFVTFAVNPKGHRYCVTDFYRMAGGESWI